MKKFFEFINGNKTLICTVVLLVLNSDYVAEAADPKLIELLVLLFYALTAGAVGHKVSKSVKKNGRS